MGPNLVTATYVHDEAGRLAFARHQGFGSWNYQYDLAGNRVWEEQSPNGWRRYFVGIGNRLDRTESNFAGIVTFAYDDNGNVVQVGGSLPKAFAYDDRQRMTEASVDGLTWTYGYDVNAWRVSKSAPGGGGTPATRYFRDGRTLEEWSGAAAPLTLVRQVVFRPDGFTPLLNCGEDAEGPYCDYVLTDHLGTPRCSLAADDGSLVWSGRLAPFGDLAYQTGSGGSMPLRFPGQWADEETGQTGLYYNWWRYYEPTLGAYAAEDPLRRDFHLLDPYLYVRGAPMTGIDPSGLESAPAVTWQLIQGYIDKNPDPHSAWESAKADRHIGEGVVQDESLAHADHYLFARDLVHEGWPAAAVALITPLWTLAKAPFYPVEQIVSWYSGGGWFSPPTWDEIVWAWMGAFDCR